MPQYTTSTTNTVYDYYRTDPWTMTYTTTASSGTYAIRYYTGSDRIPRHEYEEDYDVDEDAWRDFMSPEFD